MTGEAKRFHMAVGHSVSFCQQGLAPSAVAQAEDNTTALPVIYITCYHILMYGVYSVWQQALIMPTL